MAGSSTYKHLSRLTLGQMMQLCDPKLKRIPKEILEEGLLRHYFGDNVVPAKQRLLKRAVDLVCEDPSSPNAADNLRKARDYAFIMKETDAETIKQAIQRLEEVQKELPEGHAIAEDISSTIEYLFDKLGECNLKKLKQQASGSETSLLAEDADPMDTSIITNLKKLRDIGRKKAMEKPVLQTRKRKITQELEGELFDDLLVSEEDAEVGSSGTDYLEQEVRFPRSEESGPFLLDESGIEVPEVSGPKVIEYYEDISGLIEMAEMPPEEEILRAGQAEMALRLAQQRIVESKDDSGVSKLIEPAEPPSREEIVRAGLKLAEAIESTDDSDISGLIEMAEMPPDDEAERANEMLLAASQTQSTSHSTLFALFSEPGENIIELDESDLEILNPAQEDKTDGEVTKVFMLREVLSLSVNDGETRMSVDAQMLVPYLQDGKSVHAVYIDKEGVPPALAEMFPDGVWRYVLDEEKEYPQDIEPLGKMEINGARKLVFESKVPGSRALKQVELQCDHTKDGEIIGVRKESVGSMNSDKSIMEAFTGIKLRSKTPNQ